MRTTLFFPIALMLSSTAVSALPAAHDFGIQQIHQRGVNVSLSDLLDKAKDALDKVELPDVNVQLPDGDQVGSIWDRLLGKITS